MWAERVALQLSDSKPPISATEKVVLSALWKHGPITVRQLAERLEQSGKEWAYTTVQTLLGRLEKKGYASVDKGSVPHVFSAAVSRKTLIAQRLEDLAEDLCDGSAMPLVMALVDNPRFSGDDLEHFRKLIDEATLEEETSDDRDVEGESS